MNRSFKLKAVLFFAIACMFSVLTSKAQDAKKPPLSPRDSVSGKVNGATISINYGSPSVRGRVIWGKLEPFDTVYRAGANEATRFTTDKPIKVQGKLIPAGTYGFFVIPTEKGAWTVIFNSVAYQWGAFKYDKSKDVLRVKVTPVAVPLHERMIYTVTDKGFSMIWDKLELPVKVK